MAGATHHAGGADESAWNLLIHFLGGVGGGEYGHVGVLTAQPVVAPSTRQNSPSPASVMDSESLIGIVPRIVVGGTGL